MTGDGGPRARSSCGVRPEIYAREKTFTSTASRGLTAFFFTCAYFPGPFVGLSQSLDARRIMRMARCDEGDVWDVVAR
jgi:hypothetical protein